MYQNWYNSFCFEALCCRASAQNYNFRHTVVLSVCSAVMCLLNSAQSFYTGSCEAACCEYHKQTVFIVTQAVSI